MSNTLATSNIRTPSLSSLSTMSFAPGTLQSFVQHCNFARAKKASSGALHSNRHYKRLTRNDVVGITSARRARKAIRASLATTYESSGTSVNVKAIVTVKKPKSFNFFLPRKGWFGDLEDKFSDWFGKTLILELVSAEIDSKTGMEKPALTEYAGHNSARDEDGLVRYEANFRIPTYFGDIGAVLVENEHHTEMHIADIVLEGLPLGPIRITCNSWVHSKYDNSEKRVFFTNKSYLPFQTPSGLRSLRLKELENLRGAGVENLERQTSDRIYDYDTYNDLGDADKNPELARPVLGGKEFPYPRRCRTGRKRSESDPSSETRTDTIYVPRDEQFSAIKESTFSFKKLFSAIHGIVPQVTAYFVDPHVGFQHFTAIDKLYDEGLHLPGLVEPDVLKGLLPRLVKFLYDIRRHVLRFETPMVFERDRFVWFRDEEFARQTLAGLNPCSIKLVTEWPMRSKLDPEIYGPPESAITSELVAELMGQSITAEEAVQQKKLFMLDYYDTFMPYVHKVRELEGTTLYGSRTLFILMPSGVLRPLAIELARPPIGNKPQWKVVFTPSWDATACWLWRLAKAHVLSHDSGYHQLISHWLRTHCCTEPYIIAANRQLSAMHPIYRLLHPHFRYTMEINALARESLINAGGIIESCFAPGKYSMEMSSVIYGLEWRFDHEALPADLINRGMAVEDKEAPHGLKLAIEDYPYAKDGLALWAAIRQWVTDYVNHYYTNPSLVKNDDELQSWWEEVRNKGHADKKDKAWWPELKTPEDLIQVVTTIIWVASGHHAAVNFGQYDFAGYMPNRPTIARAKMPVEDPSDTEWKLFTEKPTRALLQSFPSQKQAATVMTILDVLSEHSPDEEYLGHKPEPAWEENPVIQAAFEKFTGRLKELEGDIDARNANPEFKNRNGAGLAPYKLLKPFSEPGVTSMGVPNSISI